MAETFLLEIVTPARKLLSAEVSEFTAPGFFGEFGVLPGHTQYMTVLKAGTLSYKSGSGSGLLAVGPGYAEVLPGRATILVETAERAEEINVEAARAGIKSAEEKLEGMGEDDEGYEAVRAALEFAEARVAAREKQGG